MERCPVFTSPYPFGSLRSSLKRGTLPGRLSGIVPEALPFILQALHGSLGRRVMVVVPTQESAEHLRRNLKELTLLDRSFQFRVELFSSTETSPYEEFSPAKGFTGDRMQALDALLFAEEPLLIIAPVAGLACHTMPAERFTRWVRRVHKGESAEPDHLAEHLLALGYERTARVEEAGQFSLRGGILDVFLCGESWATRLDFFGDEVESIRVFDPTDQRTFDERSDVTLLPASELVLDREEADRLVELQLGGSTWEEGARPPRVGVEQFMPVFYPEPVTLLDYFGNGQVLIHDPAACTAEWTDRRSAEVRARGNRKELPPTEAFFTDPQQVLAGLSLLEIHTDNSDPENDWDTIPCPGFSARFSEFIYQIEELTTKGGTIHVFLPTVGQLKRMKSLLAESGFNVHAAWEHPTAPLKNGGVNLLPGNLLGGVHVRRENTLVVTGTELYGGNYSFSREQKRVFKKSRTIYNLSELRVGDYVVHRAYGVGIYQGISTLTVQGKPHDYISIDYHAEEKLFIPCENIHLIHKYIGMDDEAPKLNKLSDGGWQRAKKNARKAVESLAQELVELYARRLQAPGHAFADHGEIEQELAESFPFQETTDQHSAIEAVLADMREPKPMDRLVCGDVGYGKTEVAVRAAFKAVCEGKQVAVLVPTTILAMQHYNTFSSRLSTFPLKVELLSRFRAAKEQKEIIKRLGEGKVDVVIGTHRLLQKDVAFKDIGLLVVDEEQRFGVKHKERLKEFKESVDVLTLTATPIPRTLYMSMAGARDMSLINTAPADRLPVKTVVSRYDENMVGTAIRRELARHGQIYYVHNRVRSIDLIGQKLKKLVPEARVRVAHGQMDEKDLERIMLDFYEHRFDLLVSTTIIENGLDIPRVNTIIVERADAHGLSQLYQLRGRVGRSKQQAFAYMFYPEEKVLTGIARKRLQTIRECSELGSGYRVAMRDLEIRGAGNLLGYRQHGQIHQVGFEMYCKLLKEAVETLQGQAEPEFEVEIEIDLDATLPANYVSDPEQKIELYQRLAHGRTEAEFEELTEEMIDRYGPLPKPALQLLEVARMRELCRKLRIPSVKEEKQHIILRFHEDAQVPPERLMLLAARHRKTVSFVPGDRVLMYVRKENLRGDNLLALLKSMLLTLAGEE